MAMLDLAQCAGMELDAFGNLQPCKPNGGEDESAIDKSDMPDLRPVGLRFLVRAGTMHCPYTAHACCARLRKLTAPGVATVGGEEECQAEGHPG